MTNFLLALAPVELAVILLVFFITFGIPLAIIIGLIVFIFRYRKAVKQTQIKIAELESQIEQLKNRND